MKLVKFAATWCAPCKMLSTVLHDVKEKGGLEGIEFEGVDIDKDMERARTSNVRGVPTLILFDDNGNEIRRRAGLMNEAEVIEFLKKD